MSTFSRPDDGADVAHVDVVDLLAAEALEPHELRDLLRHAVAVDIDVEDIHARPERAGQDAADADPADVIVVVDVRDEDLQRRLGVEVRRGHVLDDRVEEVVDELRPLRGRSVGLERRPAVAAGGVDHREIEGVVVGPEVHQQVEDLVQDLRRPRLGPVHLVDDHDGLEAVRQGLAQDVPGLRHGAVDGVDQQQAPSAMLRTRSTSPPKSAWPGVSTMLMW